MELIDNYFEALQKIYDHVGFEEDWVICPINDNTKYIWCHSNTDVRFADTLEELKSGDGNCYSNEIYTQRFYKKWVYEGEDFTMIFCDTRTDGMKYFSLFDNKKKVNYEEVIY